MEQALWEACTAGDLSQVKEILKDPRVDVNWCDQEFRRSSFYRACGHGRKEVVEHLLQDPRVDVNQRNTQGGSPFYIACQQGFADVVVLLLQDPRVDVNSTMNDGCSPVYVTCSHGRDQVLTVLLKDPRVDVNLAADSGCTPFIVTCQFGNTAVLRILLEDPRVDVNRAKRDGITALWKACWNGRIEMVRMILASGRKLDTSARSRAGPAQWHNLTATEIARKHHHYEESMTKRQGVFPEVADLVEEYSRNPREVAQRLRRELGWALPPARLFASVIFLCEGLLEVSEAAHEGNRTGASRFFRIARALHFDVQQVLANRVFGSGLSLISSVDCEIAFRNLALDLSEETTSS